MAWNVPAQFAVGAVLPASALNAFRESLQETGPAVVTTVGDLVVADGANSLARFGLPASPDGEFLRARVGGAAWEATPIGRSEIINETGVGGRELYSGAAPNDGLVVVVAAIDRNLFTMTITINGVETPYFESWVEDGTAIVFGIEEVSMGDTIAVNDGTSDSFTSPFQVRGYLIRGYLTV